MKTASDLILECRSWGSLLTASETWGSYWVLALHLYIVLDELCSNQTRPEALREAVLKDVHQYLDVLEDSRKAVEAQG